MVDADRKVINRLETGVTALTIDQAAYIARALGVPLAWLFVDDWTTPAGGGPGGGEPPT